MTLNRKSVAIFLAGLLALTLAGQYGIVGYTLVSKTLSQGVYGDLVAKIRDILLITEQLMWLPRAITDIAIILYVGMTKTNDLEAKKRLVWIEVGMTVLVILVVGPANALTHFTGTGATSWLSSENFIIFWSFLLAGVSATMIMGLNYAYTVQSLNWDLIEIAKEEWAGLQTTIKELTHENGDLLLRAEQLTQERDTLQDSVDRIDAMVKFFSLIPPSTLLQVAAKIYPAITNQDPDRLATIFDISPVTVRNTVKKLRG